MDGMKVLCVADDAVDVRTLSEIIDDLGWTATFASNGLDGYAFAQTERYNVIISDQNIDDLTGLGLFKCVRTGNGPNAHTPFLLNSWNFTPEIIREAEEMQVEALVAKPLLTMHMKENLTHLAGLGSPANNATEPSGHTDCNIFRSVPLFSKLFR